MCVVQEDRTPCRCWQAIVRGAFRVIDGIIFGLPAAISMRSPFYQRFGDKAAKTMVINQAEVINPRKILSWRLLLAVCLFPLMTVVVTFGDLAMRISHIYTI